MKEMVGRDKELLGEAASILRLPLLAEDAQGAVAKQLDGVVDPTRKFILKLDRLEQAASDLLGAAKDAEKERRGSGVERAMRRTDLSGPMRSWEKELKGLYGLFAQGRNQMMAIASGAKIPTKRFSKKKPRKKGPQKLSSTKAIRELRTIAANMGKAIRDVGEKGSFSIRKAEEIAKKLRDGKLSGDKLRDELHAWVQLHLDFRDRVSAVLYGMAGGITKRINAIRASLRGLNEEFEPIELPWLAEEDYDEWCTAEPLDEGAKRVRGDRVQQGWVIQYGSGRARVVGVERDGERRHILALPGGKEVRTVLSMDRKYRGVIEEDVLDEAMGFSKIPRAQHGEPELRRIRSLVTSAIFAVAKKHNDWTKEDQRDLATELKKLMRKEGLVLKGVDALAKGLLDNARLGQRTVNSGDLDKVGALLDRHVSRRSSSPSSGRTPISGSR
jgi:hypothetical protein